MNSALLFWVLSLACWCTVTLGSEVTRTPASEERSSVTSSGTDIQSSADEDNELEQNDVAELPLAVQHLAKKEGRNRKKGKGKKRHKGASHSTPSDAPSHAPTHTPGHTSAQVEGEDLCLTTHQHYCIHGDCKYMADLREPTCVCMMGYDGERCGIQLMKTELKKADEEVVQTVLVVIAVVLSLISCCAILLMICAHYRTHKNFLAAYLGPSSEKEKLQTDGNGAVV
ncbi:proheparin-binding EGF-like growth factor isoform X1 [Anguilla anguilla]|uniref:proheparin-binding EGF-like growth factor isoform X1 n=1 Tax=Anguilla anguilla TaxID=7936 RepID=UPI0015AD39F8|nr:proheparin-binding EGF-like growth factor isoform X1 [Anguilla anguilla]